MVENIANEFNIPKNNKARRLIDKIISMYDVADENISEVFRYLELKGFGQQIRNYVMQGISNDFDIVFEYSEKPQDILDYMASGELEGLLIEYLQKSEVREFINNNSWNMSSIRHHLRWLEIHNVDYKKIGGNAELSGKGDLQRYTSELLRSAQKYIIIKSGDFDFVQPNTKAVEDGMLSGQEWIKLYEETVSRGVDVRIIMNIDAQWTAKNARILQSTGAKVMHYTNEWRAGIVDGEKMFAFMRGPTVPGYRKIVGTSQVQLDKMFYLGYVTDYHYFADRINFDLNELWDKSTPADEVIKEFEYDPNLDEI